MKSSLLLNSLLLATLVTGCHRETTSELAGDPKVTGTNISFPADSPQLAALETAPVESRSSARTELSGRLTWNDDVTVRIFTPFAGRVRKIMADLGQPVEKNAPLAEVESPDFGQARADTRKASSDLQLAQRTLARLQELFAHGAAPKKDVEAAEAAESQAESEHMRAVSKLAVYGSSADSADEMFPLQSPIAGVVVDKSVNPGQEIRPDMMLANMPQFTAPLFVVSDPTRLWIQIDATEVDLPKLQPGRVFTFTSRAFPNQTFTGRVDKVAEFIDSNTRTIKVRGAVDNARRLLKAEMFVSVNVNGDNTATISAPTAAVFLKGEKHFVFVQDKPGQFTRQEIAISAEQADRVLVASGLQPGQQVVTSGCMLLQQLLE